MSISFETIQYLLITINQILTAGIAITAFALILYSTQFNLRNRVARTFSFILICVAIIYTGESISGVMESDKLVATIIRFEWIGIIFIPATYLHFSDAILATTGKPSKWKRVWAIRATYLICVLFLLALPFPSIFGEVNFNQPYAPQLQPTLITFGFTLFYLVTMAMSWFNFFRAYRRTTTSTSRRRMAYLITGALAPAFGSFPFLLFGSGIAIKFTFFFWLVALSSNFLVVGLLVLMAYAVAFFGVSWPDRVVKSRLLEWLLRGPMTAILALGMTTIIRRLGAAYGDEYSAYVPIVLVITVLFVQYSITILFPYIEKWLFFGKDREDLNQLRNFENRFLTNNDIHQFMELVLAAICDRLQAPGGFISMLNSGKVEMLFSLGKNRYKEQDIANGYHQMISMRNGSYEFYKYESDLIISIQDEVEEEDILLGLIGITDVGDQEFEQDQIEDIRLLVDRMRLALHDRLMQRNIFSTFQTLQPDVDMIQRIRAAGRYDGRVLFENNSESTQDEIVRWVKEALTHYWGGPRLTQNPLMQLKIVNDAVEEHEGSSTNALRSILKEAIERIKPEGERRYTADWILYNILEMKFVEGRKVKDIALRLSMSEADLYRKQRIAIEAIAGEVSEMEKQALTKD